MNRKRPNFRPLAAAAVAVALGAPFAVKAVEANFSGITEYIFEPNPQEIAPKMYNWEIRLNKADSRKGAYEIVQVTSLRPARPGAVPTKTVLVDSSLISPDEHGVIDFKLRIGDKQPTQNMGRRGDIGQPVIFSGIGTAKAQSGWIVLPGAKVSHVSPSPNGTRLTNGKLDFIQFIYGNVQGEQYQADVILRRK